ncbi:TonB-dependent siderophore receptor [Undibacterium sp. RTI2.1]|uniref:TonB-dependent siderophore receptor n=1 Tax=unclassified Undibacterium TaxID=2630295 RepID=UPI002B22CDBF|nr:MULTISPECIES: TonB-dependent siderophore receptor [unclassified Undibacterium]MEB0031987.1 TonB-dependent siderophore receptor [Undibacterium sp. RTI2.1]MEB0118196.1 TonB-dependent siderophore receptor [Undibacterium sp. RTI2.2]
MFDKARKVRYLSSFAHQNLFSLKPLSLALSTAIALIYPAIAFSGEIADAGNPATELPEVVVKGVSGNEQSTEKTGAYTARKSNSATRLDLSLRETPQSVSVVTRAKMDDFKQVNINDVLGNTTGVSVEKVETDRTYYMARGFDITNFQYDGIGVPFTSGNVTGDIDTAIYDRIDIVRGANGLMSATGNPSATVNFIRKHPTYQFQASTGLTLGSWNTRRVDADISGALNAAGTVAGRFVVAKQAGDSYLDRYSPEKTVFYGIVEANLGDATVLSIGHSHQKSDAKGGMWGALPLYYTDGSPTNYRISTSTAADWSRWVTQDDRSFVELSHQLNNDWQIKAAFSRNKSTADSKLFYVYGTPDRSTGLGLYSYPSLYNSDNTQTLFDVAASGKFNFAGRQHDLSFGVNWSKSKMDDISHYGVGIGTALPDISNWTGNYPEPAFNASIEGSAYEDKQQTVFLASRINLADQFKLIAGVNVTKADSTGFAYGVSSQKSARNTTPYLGLVYDIAPNASIYASHTEIFNPQSEIDINGKTLDPVKGKSDELGFKTELFDRKLNLSAALFKTQQNNAAEQAGYVGAKAYYKGIDAESQGLELDASGEIAKGWQVSAGYTQLTLKGSDGQDVKTYVPRKLFRVSSTYQLPFLTQAKVGASMNWQADTFRDEGAGIVIRQASYAVVNLMARYDVNPKLSISANLNNIGNQQYLTSLYWSQGYYAAPRNGSVAINWKY